MNFVDLRMTKAGEIPFYSSGIKTDGTEAVNRVDVIGEDVSVRLESTAKSINALRKAAIDRARAKLEEIAKAQIEEAGTE